MCVPVSVVVPVIIVVLCYCCCSVNMEQHPPPPAAVYHQPSLLLPDPADITFSRSSSSSSSSAICFKCTDPSPCARPLTAANIQPGPGIRRLCGGPIKSPRRGLTRNLTPSAHISHAARPFDALIGHFEGLAEIAALWPPTPRRQQQLAGRFQSDVVRSRSAQVGPAQLW